MKLATFWKQDDKYINVVTGEEVEEVTLGFIIGKNGVFISNSGLGHSVIRPVNGEMSALDEIKESVSYSYPQISFDVYQKALKFCRAVFVKYKAEANVLLSLDRSEPLARQEYKMWIPKQKVGSATVDYTDGLEEIHTAMGENEFLAGSIHSHPDFSAFQSGTDHADEINFDGVHITLGHINRKNTPPEIDQRLCILGQVYESKQTPLINTLPPMPDIEIPSEWIDQVEESRIVTVGGYGNNWANQNRGHGWYGRNNNVSIASGGKKSVPAIIKAMKPKNHLNQKNTNPDDLVSLSDYVDTKAVV